MSHMTIQDEFLAEVDRFLEATGMAETTFGRRAVNDGKFIGRLRRGKTVTLSVLERARSWMRAHADPEAASGEAA